MEAEPRNLNPSAPNPGPCRATEAGAAQVQGPGHPLPDRANHAHCTGHTAHQLPGGVPPAQASRPEFLPLSLGHASVGSDCFSRGVCTWGTRGQLAGPCQGLVTGPERGGRVGCAVLTWRAKAAGHPTHGRKVVPPIQGQGGVTLVHGELPTDLEFRVQDLGSRVWVCQTPAARCPVELMPQP